MNAELRHSDIQLAHTDLVPHLISPCPLFPRPHPPPPQHNDSPHTPPHATQAHARSVSGNPPAVAAMHGELIHIHTHSSCRLTNTPGCRHTYTHNDTNTTTLQN